MTTLDTFRTMLDILEEFPEYKFSQSQASVYRIVEKYEPKMLEKIRKYVKEGRWEVTASTWVEADKNMPVGESFARHALYTKRYLSELLGIDMDSLNIDFEPDTFGHSRNIPEIDSKSGVKYYYHCRGNDGGHYLYRWRSPSGAEVILYRDPYFYNTGMDSSVADDVIDLAEKTGLKTLLKVYGVGDHGGGPTRRDVKKMLEMGKWPIFPQICPGTLGEYFREAEKIRESLPIESEEINVICDGCYTSQSRIKAGNARSERGLKEAEAFSAFASLEAGLERKDYRKSWEKTLFNQFHDILTGSGIIVTREYASGQYQKVEADVRAGRKQALLALTERIDTSGLTVSEDADRSFGAGSGHSQSERGNGSERIYHLFNGRAVSYKGAAEVLVWDYEEDAESLVFADSHGNKLESQLLEKGGYWGHIYHKFLVWAKIPAFGYTTIVTGQEETDTGFIEGWQQRRQHEDKFILENAHIRAVIDNLTGAVVSLLDKRTGKEKLDRDRGGARLCIIGEANAKEICAWDSSMSSWFVGRHKKVEPIEESVEIVPGVSGELRNSVKLKAKLRSSSFEWEIGLDKDSRDLDYTLHCDWREFGDENERIPSLAFVAALSEKSEGYVYDVPFGSIRRNPEAIDVPGNSFIASETGVMVISEAKYGFRGVDDTMMVKLLRSSTNPDPIPEICHHDMKFSLALAKDESRESLIRKSQAKYIPIQVISGRKQEGSLSTEGAFLSHQGASVISAVKLSEDVKEALVLRSYEVRGEASEETFTFTKPVKQAYTVDTTERRRIDTLKTEGNHVYVESRPYQVTTVLVEFTE